MRTAIRLTIIAALLVTSPALMASALENPDVVKGGPTNTENPRIR